LGYPTEFCYDKSRNPAMQNKPPKTYTESTDSTLSTVYTDYSDCTPHGQNTGNSTDSAVVFIPVLNPENRILHWNENKSGFGTVFIPPQLGV
jgi:hypothetical protein